MNATRLCQLALLLATACQAGRIGEPGAAASGPDGPAAAGGAAPVTAMPALTAAGAAASSGAQVNAFEPASGTLHKLTVEQYVNSVHDLLGSDVQLPAELTLEPDAAQNGFYAVAASHATVSPSAAEKYEQAAYALAEQALAPERRAALVPCAPAAVSDSACAQRTLQGFGRRAFRRPLDADELRRYVEIADSSAQALGDFYQGLEFAVAGMLQSPNFLFRVELGEPDPSTAGRLRYCGYELATRLSYTLWNTTPDAALLAAADSGELDAAGLAAQAERLLSDARAARALDNFHSERLGLLELSSLTKSQSLVGELDDNLRAALRDDVLRTFAELTRSPGQDFLQVFESRVAYMTPALSALYGVPLSGSGLTRSELPAAAPRAGFLGKPAFLALTSHNLETSPTLRGKYIRERILCESIPAPPANVVPVLGEPDPNAPTLRDRLKAHATDPSCAGCHNQMDPLGLALEHFDAVGRYRDQDNGHALDTSGDLDGVPFDGIKQLSALLRADPRSAQCLVRQAYRYTLGHVEDAGEEPQIELLLQAFEASGHDLGALFRALVQSDAFRYAAAASKESP